VAFVSVSRDRDASSGFVSRLMVQTAGGEPIATTVMPHIFGHAWSRDGREVWFTGSETGSPLDRALYALPLRGRPRLMARAPGAITVYDVSPDNTSALVITGAGWFGINARIEDARDERSLDHAGRADIVGITADGTRVLLNEMRDVARGALLKTTDGTQMVTLDPGIGHGLSPEGAWAVVLSRENPPRIKLVSTGAAGVRDLPLEGALEPVLSDHARWSGDSRRMFILLVTEKDSLRSTRVHLHEERGSWRAVTPAGLPGPFVVSPRGDIIAMNNDAGVVTLYYVDGRPPTTLTGETGTPVHWTSDERELLLSGPDRFPGRVYRRDIATGRVQPWRTIAPTDPAGVLFIGRVLVAADNRSYVYQYSRGLHDLYLASNLR
ncbi:MAG TPA: hypothetical protein VFB99_14865, partial [Vicinamibacterales bacterium]|nr:hypothetical protein [Vicinamibacterales bacterium]